MERRTRLRSGAARLAAILSAAVCAFLALVGARGIEPGREAPNDSKRAGAVEHGAAFNPSEPLETPVPRPADFGGRVAAVSPRAIVSRGAFVSVQVNVDANGNNILDDAANEPTIAVDPTDPARLAIAWRQFDTVNNNFRQAGMGNSQDGGATWNARVLDPGQFRSDPVLASDRNGNFYFSSLSSSTSVDLFRSLDGGETWLGPVDAHGGDKQWITVDRTTGIGSGNIYQIWNTQFSCCGDTDFARSINGGVSFQAPRSMPQPKLKWGTIDVDPDGRVLMAGVNLGATAHLFVSSSNAQNSAVIPTFSAPTTIDLGGGVPFGAGPNPGGLLGQTSIATDHSSGPTRGNIYVLSSVNPPGADPLDVMFIRSTDGGQTWSTPLRINDDAPSFTGWQWFGTMSVSPHGRIEVVWNDTRNDVTVNFSELYYSSSNDGGTTWSANIPITPPWDHHEGYPDQSKIGDYYHMVSLAGATHLAFAATFNDEQDVYYMRIATDCNLNGVEDPIDISDGTSLDCAGNEIPDECEPDCNGNGAADTCDIFSGTSEDCTANGVPDECESDCNENGEADVCEIAKNATPDINDNGIPDECEAILYVRQNATGNRNGLNWTDAYDDLQAALAHAATPARVVSEIWVASGKYVPSLSDRSDSFQLQNNLAIYGGFSGNETDRALRNWHRNLTILSGDILGNDSPGRGGRADNSHHVVECEDCGTARLDGFVVTSGYADGGPLDRNGAGIVVNGGEPLIQNCVILDNHAVSQGGGVYASATNAGFLRCLIARNEALEGAAIYNTRGGVVQMYQCTIAQNAASAIGAAAGDYSGNGLWSWGSIFWGNTDFSESLEDAQITGMSTVDITYSTVEGWTGQYGGTENNGDDPLFADIDGVDDVEGTLDDNFRLGAGSPAINSGRPSTPLDGPPPDLDGHQRVLCGRIDRGAYEFGIGDYDCDQAITLEDFGFFPSCLVGPEGGPPFCWPFNFDADYDVDLIDYGLLQVHLSE